MRTFPRHGSPASEQAFRSDRFPSPLVCSGFSAWAHQQTLKFVSLISALIRQHCERSGLHFNHFPLAVCMAERSFPFSVYSNDVLKRAARPRGG